jgi:hypothetical protein
VNPPVTVTDGTGLPAVDYPGAFLDVNDDFAGNTSYCGYYNDGTDYQGCFWNNARGPNNPIFPTVGRYDGSNCMGLNGNDDVCGQVFSAAYGNPPAFWHYTGGSPPWTLVDFSGSMGFSVGSRMLSGCVIQRYSLLFWT